MDAIENMFSRITNKEEKVSALNALKKFRNNLTNTILTKPSKRLGINISVTDILLSTDKYLFSIESKLNIAQADIDNEVSTIKKSQDTPSQVRNISVSTWLWASMLEFFLCLITAAIFSKRT